MATESNRDKIIELSRDIIQHIGYHSFNYKQIAVLIGIKNSSIHHYFPAKEDLGVAVIESDSSDFNDKIKNWNLESPLKRTDYILDLYQQYFNDGMKLCIIGTFGSSYEDIPEKLQTAVNVYIEKIAQWLSETFKDGLASGEFRFKGTPEAMASAWLSTLAGSLQMGRLRGAVHFEETLDHLRNSII
ncbi:TetR/AcrR family transcriptional regulator [Dyadobacter subterraneus]|uniref:TetR/AcrR family transcriptional regulator n=1 Tax=Dyadobacter subterraneus TaxID=2773304 RepID=A0ABR9WJS1_9BACT|nr:TetR/AcrR family transcriptional regulator [Dyadobacter subterraneus]MBE9465758.1 TetR/AcrR family transcriptional regulator [Dyadobacter subterraneus]